MSSRRTDEVVLQREAGEVWRLTRLGGREGPHTPPDHTITLPGDRVSGDGYRGSEVGPDDLVGGGGFVLGTDRLVGPSTVHGDHRSGREKRVGTLEDSVRRCS